MKIFKKNFLKILQKLKIQDYLVLVFLIIGFLIRINHFAEIYVMGEGDVGRDYLVAHHIVKYHEFPLIGPWNSVYGSLRNSPVYYYLLAFFLLIKDDPLFLGYINIFLQIISLILLYVLASKLLSKNTGLIAFLLYGFSNESMNHGHFVWQPHTQQPFVIFSYLILYLAFYKKSFNFLILFTFIFAFASALGFYTFSLIPIFLLLLIVVLKSMKAKLSQYILIISLLILQLIIFYIPVIYNLFINNSTSFIVTEPVYTLGPFSFLNNLINNLKILIDIFFFLNNSQLINIIVLSIFLILFFSYFIFATISNKNKFKALLLIFISPLIFASFLKTPIYHHYFQPIFGLFMILIAEVINSVINNKFRILKFIIVALFIYVFSAKFYYLKWERSELNLKNVEAVTHNIKEEIYHLAKLLDNPYYDFFQIKLYIKGDGLSASDSVFWVQLEKDLNMKFTKVVDDMNNYDTLNGDEYIFLICQGYDDNDGIQTCLSDYGKNYNYTFIKKIYNRYPYSIYLTKKNE